MTFNKIKRIQRYADFKHCIFIVENKKKLACSLRNFNIIMLDLQKGKGFYIGTISKVVYPLLIDKFICYSLGSPISKLYTFIK